MKHSKLYGISHIVFDRRRMAFYLEREEWFMGKKRTREKNDTFQWEIAFDFLCQYQGVVLIRFKNKYCLGPV